MAGIGSIEKRGKGTYRLTVCSGFDADGNHIRHRKTVKAPNKIEAKKELSKFYNEVQTNEYVTPQKMTLSAFVDEWRSKYSKKNLHPNTQQNYERQLKVHIIPKIGHMRLDKIKTLHLIDFMDSLERKDGKQGELSSNSRLYVYCILSSVFSKAVDWKVISSNPMNGVDRPKAERVKEIVAYELYEISKLLGLLSYAPYHYQIIIKLALYMGLRRGEILGLTWDHINLVEGTLEVKQSWSRGMIKPPKNKASYRLLQFPDDLLNDLKKYRNHWDQEMTGLGLRSLFLFPKLDGQPINERALARWLERFLDRHQLRSISMHGFRHTYVALAISQGIHVKDISDQLGHADIQTTMNIYGHILKTTKQETANKMNALIRSIQEI